jgi:hypothetical protein
VIFLFFIDAHELDWSIRNGGWGKTSSSSPTVYPAKRMSITLRTIQKQVSLKTLKNVMSLRKYRFLWRWTVSGTSEEGCAQYEDTAVSMLGHLTVWVSINEFIRRSILYQDFLENYLKDSLWVL